MSMPTGVQPAEVLPTDIAAAGGTDPTAVPDPLAGAITGPSTALGQAQAAQAADALAKQQAAQQAMNTTTDVGPIDPSVYAYGGGAPSIGNKIVQAAEHYLGVPYAWGGSNANGLDCSGLVQLAYKAAGINLPRISFQQAAAGTRVSSMRNLRPGDLIGWDNSSRNNGADHIAIYLGNGEIIEAARPGTNVRIRALGADEGEWFIRMGW